jgi:hypothetical protein
MNQPPTHTHGQALHFDHPTHQIQSRSTLPSCFEPGIASSAHTAAHVLLVHDGCTTCESPLRWVDSPPPPLPLPRAVRRSHTAHPASKRGMALHRCEYCCSHTNPPLESPAQDTLHRPPLHAHQHRTQVAIDFALSRLETRRELPFHSTKQQPNALHCRNRSWHRIALHCNVADVTRRHTTSWIHPWRE